MRKDVGEKAVKFLLNELGYDRVRIVGSFLLLYLSKNLNYEPNDLDIVVACGCVGEVQRIVVSNNGTFLERTNRYEGVILGVNRIRKLERNPSFHVYNGDFCLYDAGTYLGRVPLCVFEGRVDVIDIDFEERFDVIVSNGLRVPAPPLGVYYITMLHPYAATKERAERVAKVINDRGEDPEKLAYVSREALREAVLEYGIPLDRLRKTRNMLLNQTKKGTPFWLYAYETYNLEYLTRSTHRIPHPPYLK
ncbi:MAG: hypothetical protein QXM38_00510 [Candidatus Aenigmatarchaeota archaeon]